MKKSSPSTKTKSAPGKKAPVTSQFKDRNLSATSPSKEQFEPTDSIPVNQHKRMAGAA